MKQAVECLASATTIVAIFGCVMVVLHYGPTALRAIYDRVRYGTPLERSDLLAIGISFGFFFTLLALSWWNIAWTRYFMEREITFFTENGAIANTMLRFVPISLTAACHIYAAVKAQGRLGWKVVLIAMVLSFSVYGLTVAIAAR